MSTFIIVSSFLLFGFGTYVFGFRAGSRALSRTEDAYETTITLLRDDRDYWQRGYFDQAKLRMTSIKQMRADAETIKSMETCIRLLSDEIERLDPRNRPAELVLVPNSSDKDQA